MRCRQPSSIERWEPVEGPSQQGGGLQGSGSAGERLAAAQQLLQNLRLLPAAGQPAANGATSEASTQGVHFVHTCIFRPTAMCKTWPKALLGGKPHAIS